MRNHYRAQKDRILQQLKSSSIADRISVRMEKEGLHFLLEIHSDLEDSSLIAHCIENGLRISCLSQYYHGTPTTSHVIVVNYAGLTRNQTEEAVSRLIQCICDLID